MYNHGALFCLLGSVFAYRNQGLNDMIKGVDVIVIQYDFMLTICRTSTSCSGFLVLYVGQSNLHKFEYTYFAQTQSSRDVCESKNNRFANISALSLPNLCHKIHSITISLHAEVVAHIVECVAIVYFD